MTVPPYKLAARQLVENDEQWAAYESSGNFVTLAGPGSGKTKVLTTKLARIVNEDVETPRGVACVTFSNECARELKHRLSILGIQQSRQVFVGTVHSFCFQKIVRPFAQLGGIGLRSPLRVATSIEQDRCFAKGLEKALSSDESPHAWRFTCAEYRRLYLDRDVKDWYGRNKAAARIIEEYEKQLRSLGLIDYDDMMLLGLRLIEKFEWVRRAIRAKFPVLVVDEYQDLGVPLHRLVLSLCFRDGESNARLFAVGDPDQSIYGFTGARPELLRELSQRADVESVTLQLNYRSRQKIISASEIALGEERGYRSANDDVGVIDFHYRKEGLREQARFICEDLVPEIIESGTAASKGEIAVLYRTKNEGDVIAEAAEAADLNFMRIDNNAAYQKTPLTRWLEDCALWCSFKGQAGAPSLRSLIADYLSFNQTIASERSRLNSIHQLVSCLRMLSGVDMPLQSWLRDLEDSCLRSHLSADPIIRQDTESLDDLLSASKPGGKLEAWTVARFGGQGGTPSHLNLMTLHSSKGLEFDVVILFGMDQGIIPSYKENSAESKREPRRLFYVGLTRARHEVHITFSGWRDTPWGRKRDGVSEFVVELKKKLKEAT